MDDNALMARLAAGDTEALEELIARHRAAAMHQAEAMLGDHALAEDIVQEAFARVYLLRHRYKPEFAFTTYLAAMVRNLCIDQMRRQKVRQKAAEAFPAGEADSAEAMFLARESRMQLWNELRSLDEADRALLTGYALEGLSYQALARKLHMTLPQVKMRLHRIRKRLRKERDE